MKQIRMKLKMSANGKNTHSRWASVWFLTRIFLLDMCQVKRVETCNLAMQVQAWSPTWSVKVPVIKH